jgi:hypothetical protein
LSSIAASSANQQRVPERQDVDHAGEPDVARTLRRGGDQQIGRGDRRCRLQVVLVEPDLIDADALSQLDLVQLAPEQFPVV